MLILTIKQKYPKLMSQQAYNTNPGNKYGGMSPDMIKQLRELQKKTPLCVRLLPTRQLI